MKEALKDDPHKYPHKYPLKYPHKLGVPHHEAMAEDL
jgi:hypothetical protein